MGSGKGQKGRRRALQEESRAAGFTSLRNTQPESTDGLVLHSGTELLDIYFPGPE